MVSFNGSSVTLLSSLFIVALVVLCTFSENFSSVIGIYGSESEYKLDSVQLKTKMIVSSSSGEVRAVQFGRSSSGFDAHRSKNRIRHSKQIRKKRSKSKLEQGLVRSRAAIRRASVSVQNQSLSVDNEGFSDRMIFRNPGAFYQSYMEMERRLKVYVYEEGEPPIIHDGPCKDIYTIEGRFIQEMEHGNNQRFRTRDPNHAHLYFMPFSVTRMVKYLYKPLTYNVTPLKEFVSDYVRVVSTKHPFWNRTNGADHFMLACHDWGPHASRGNQHLYNTSIRVLCNANTSEGFNPQKDVSLPEIHLYDGNISPKLTLLPHSSSPGPRPHLAFFAGGLHGPIRPLLLQHWKNKDPDLLVYEYLPKNLDYYTLMLNSRFCLCPSGHEVASPRIVEALYAECVPVIISQHYSLPFEDVLDWGAFSISVEVLEIPRLKEVLNEVSEEKYEKLKMGVRAVRKHFVLNQPAKRFDVFHMILHSIWLRRINVELA